ncbi:MAG TPA: phosphoglycerate kinase [Rhizomicrobium sp.]|jgi:phosphoglycerate kinase|nr:phosphoglycerate kinase [Rhizomicrobium sp.]
MAEENYRTLDDLAVSGKRVLVRADLNVPMQDGKVTDTLRIERQAPTIRELSAKGARVILLSHFGRPKGRPVASMSLERLVPALSEVLGRPVSFAGDCIGPNAEQAVSELKDGDVLVLENTRFHMGEEANDPEFARAVAALGDDYVNDAFSAAHRAHATTEALAHLMPCAAGRAMEMELTHLHRALNHPERPVMAVVGGAKISTKLELLGNLMRRVDVLVIGGAMANTFLAAQGLEIGKSLSETDHLETARDILESANAHGAALVLPVDVVVAKEFKPHAECRVAGVKNVGSDEMILDVGPETIDGFAARLDQARTLVWNGPFGAFETPPFERGTLAAAKHAVARTAAGKLLSVAGGGDTVAALSMAGVVDQFSYVSTAGGAFLEWLEGRELPGVAALVQNRDRNDELG